jgi:tRNA(Arg) A34 adenosine deaminase TadA
MVDDRDGAHLRTAIAASRSARDKGNEPYGAVLVSAGDQILAIAENTQIVERDCTGHAETNLVRALRGAIAKSALETSTLYASGEPCAMCAAAIYYAGIGRVVFALGRQRMVALSSSDDGIAISAADLLALARPTVIVEGPFLDDEAAEVLLGR